MMAFAAARLLVLGARAADFGQWRRFGYRHVPPGFATPDTLVAVDGHDNDADAVARPRVPQRGLDLRTADGEHRVRAHRRRVGGEVDTDGHAVELARITAPLVTRAESVAADQLKAFVERIERLEEEKAGIAGDIKDVYAEAKGNGFAFTL